MSGPDQLRWAEIDLSAVAHNVGQLRARLSPGAKLAAVVKANAYGHGATEVARAAVSAGAEWLCVATVAEGVELRAGGVTAPILNMGPTPAAVAGRAIAAGLRCCVFEPDGIEVLANAAERAGRQLPVHLKIDTGMARLGAPVGEALDLARQVEASPALQLEALWTHLAEADNRESLRNDDQLSRFLGEVDRIRRAGIEPAMVHCANGAATLLNPSSHLDMVRCGLPVYGYSPTSAPVDGLKLRPVMTWKSRVVALHHLDTGDRVGYGGDFAATSPLVSATVAVGYADGYSRRLSDRGTMLVRGSRVPVVGRVSMDFATVDVTAVPGVRIGDEVVLLGSQGEAFIGADEMAESLDTIPWEVLSRVGPRVVRFPVDYPQAISSPPVAGAVNAV
ncbi:MAG TPA: alanine racemase [Candidatus Dormibacteraeota bacterium]|nr:alanine racemase [Candidatus Dormibacteraeota bacterium]